MKSLPDDLLDDYAAPYRTRAERLAADRRAQADQSLAAFLLESETFGRIVCFIVAVACGVLIGGIVVGFWPRGAG